MTDAPKKRGITQLALYLREQLSGYGARYELWPILFNGNQISFTIVLFNRTDLCADTLNIGQWLYDFGLVKVQIQRTVFNPSLGIVGENSNQDYLSVDCSIPTSIDIIGINKYHDDMASEDLLDDCLSDKNSEEYWLNVGKFATAKGKPLER